MFPSECAVRQLPQSAFSDRFDDMHSNILMQLNLMKSVHPQMKTSHFIFSKLLELDRSMRVSQNINVPSYFYCVQ
jgi:hypothetical protein